MEKLTVEENHASWIVRDRRHRLEIDARRDRTIQTGVLRGPTGLDMGGRVPESLQAVVDLRLLHVADRQVIFEDTGRNTGLEIVEPHRLRQDDK